MERLLQQFEQPVTDKTGQLYNVYLYGRSRPHDTWQGWLVFERLSDGQRFTTNIETTQANEEAVLYWATGLTAAYFDGALVRAQRPPGAETVQTPVPLPLVGGDAATRRWRLAELERAILASFHRHGTTRLLTQTLFDDDAHAHADVVRALEDLEQQGGLLVRRTDEGNDWVVLTAAGAEAAGLPATTTSARVEREPPRLP